MIHEAAHVNVCLKNHDSDLNSSLTLFVLLHSPAPSGRSIIHPHRLTRRRLPVDASCTSQIGVMDKERETGDGTLDRFSHYPYAPSSVVAPQAAAATAPYSGPRNLPPLIDASDQSLASSQPVPNPSLMKRNQINLSSYAFPPGFVDHSNHDDLNQVIKQTIMNNGKAIE